MIVQELPVGPVPVRFTTTLRGRGLEFSTHFHNQPGAGWLIDIRDAVTNETLVAGLALVCDLDLLWPYRYLGLGFSLFVKSDDRRDQPTFDSLGVRDHLLAGFS
jgi:hypothetical protein